MTETTLRAACAAAALCPVALHPVAAYAQDAGSRDAPEGDVIIVSGSPLDRTQDELLAGASVLSGEELIRQAAGSLGETLRLEPGVASTAFGAGASRPIIRGLGGDRVRVLTNGVGSIDASAASPDHAVPIEPLTAERIEVVRGTALLRYGSSAAGGVVNVLDGRLPSEVPEDGIDGAVFVRGTTVDDGAEAAGQVTAEAFDLGGVSVLLSAGGSWREADDYDIPGFAESAALRAAEAAEEEGEEHADEEGHGDEDHDEDEEVRDTLENSFVEDDSVSAGISFVGERGFLAFGFQDTNSTYGVPGGHGHGHGHEGEEEGEEHGDEDHEEEEGVFIGLDQTRYDVNGRLEMDGPFRAVQLFAGYADYTHTEFESAEEAGTVFANEGWEARLELLQAQRGAWSGATGVQYRDRDFSAIGEEAFVPPTTTSQLGLFTFQELRSGPWHAEAAIRYENTEHERQEDGFARDLDGFSASLGAGYDVTEHLDVAATVLRTERAPTTEELFSNGPHLATDQFELGDPTLDIETALGVEALAHLHGDRGFVTLNVFYTDYDDFIYERETGDEAAEFFAGLGTPLDEEEAEEFGELPVFAFTAADARFVGLELYGGAELYEGGGFTVSADGVLDLVDAELTDTDGNENLPRIPPLSVTAGVEAEGYGGSFRVEAEHAAEQDEVASFELPTDSYTLLNLHAAYEVAPGVTLRAALLNATDEEARVHSSFLKEVAPLPGRNLRVSLGLAF